jgi:uncharacterized protein YndB with AHSA1/START domain
MPEIARHTQVTVPAEQAFAYLSDIGKHSEWANQKLEVERVDSGPIVVGSKWEAVGHQFGKHAATVTITELVPNQIIKFESDGDVGLFRHAFHMEPSQGASMMLSKTMEPVEVRSIPLRVLGPVVRGFIAPRNLDSDLSRIKAKLEGS